MIAKDKKKHLALGSAITTVCAIVIILIWKPILHPEWVLVSGIVGCLAGIGKEVVWDKLLGKGTPELKDALATIWASLTTAILIYMAYIVYLNITL